MLNMLRELYHRIDRFVAENRNLLIIVAVAAYVRAIVISLPKDFWHDEAFQYLYSLKPVSYILAGNDVHPPLYNLFTKLLVAVFGNDIFMLRWAGAAALSVGAVSLLYYLVRDIFGERVALYSALFVAVTPTYLYYAVEFRNYSFTLFFLMLQIWAFNHLLGIIKSSSSYSFADKVNNSTVFSNTFNSNKFHLVAYILLSTVVLYAHFLTSLIIFTQIIYTFFLRWRKEITAKTLSKFNYALIIITALCLPLLHYSFTMLSKVESFWFKDISLGSLFSTFSYLVTPPLTVLVGIVLFVYGVTIYGLLRYRKDLTHKHLQFALYLIVPIVTMWLISVFLIPFYAHRYFIFGGVGLFVLLAWALVRMTERDKDIDGCGFALYCFLGFMAFNSGFGDAFQTDILDSVHFLSNYTRGLPGCDTGCITIHTSQFSQTPYKVYFPNHEHYLISNFTERQRFTAGGSVIDPEEVYPNISAVPRHRYMYFVSHYELPDAKTIYRGDGLYVQEIN